MRRISLPATAETEQIMRMSRRLVEIADALDRQIDRLPLVLARQRMENVLDDGDGKSGEEVDDRGAGRGADSDGEGFAGGRRQTP